MNYIKMAPLGGFTGYGGGPPNLSMYSIGTPAYQGSGDWYGPRAIFAGGYVDNDSNKNTIDYVAINSTSNATDFGDITSASQTNAAGGGSTNMAVIPHFTGGTIDVINNVNNTGNSTSFGDMTQARGSFAASSSGTRALFSGGWASNTHQDTIDFIHFDTANSSWDFADLSVARHGSGGCGSDTRALVFGGVASGSANDTIDYTTYATLSDATDFGDMDNAAYGCSGCSDNSWALMASGYETGYVTKWRYVVIDTASNAINYGDLIGSNWYYAVSTSDGDRGIFAGGRGGAMNANINYRDISTTGNAQDAGDLTQARQSCGSTSG